MPLSRVWKSFLTLPWWVLLIIMEIKRACSHLLSLVAFTTISVCPADFSTNGWTISAAKTEERNSPLDLCRKRQAAWLPYWTLKWCQMWKFQKDSHPGSYHCDSTPVWEEKEEGFNYGIAKMEYSESFNCHVSDWLWSNHASSRPHITQLSITGPMHQLQVRMMYWVQILIKNPCVAWILEGVDQG